MLQKKTRFEKWLGIWDHKDNLRLSEKKKEKMLLSFTGRYIIKHDLLNEQREKKRKEEWNIERERIVCASSRDDRESVIAFCLLFSSPTFLFLHDI